MSIDITVTDVVEHVFCPKFTYFGKIIGIPQNEKKRGTVIAGRMVHLRRATKNRGYEPVEYRGGTTIIEHQLYSQEHGFTGKIDRAIIRESDAVVFETKYAKPFIGPTLITQLALQAILIQENFLVPCTMGVVLFLKGGRKSIKVTIDEQSKETALASLAGVRSVMNNGIMPPSKYDRRCDDCCYRRICPVGSLKISD